MLAPSDAPEMPNDSPERQGFAPPRSRPLGRDQRTYLDAECRDIRV
jgi:hypothetical protein